jgi:hypothetical protein
LKADGPCFNTISSQILDPLGLSRYQDCGNGTVTDTVTGLVWLKNANCFGTKQWAAANQAAVVLADGQCGLSDGSSAGDWRLPTKEEWEATVAQARAFSPACSNPALTDTSGMLCYSVGVGADQPFTNVQSDIYWSSTAHANPTYACIVDLRDGSVENVVTHKANYTHVWPVRGGR